MIFFSFSSEGRGILRGLPYELEKSLIGEEGSMLTSSVMYDFSPKWSDIQDDKNFLNLLGRIYWTYTTKTKVTLK